MVRPYSLREKHSLGIQDKAPIELPIKGPEGSRYPLRGRYAHQPSGKKQAPCFREYVVELMREYAQFDPARGHYMERASAVASGALPEDHDVPFYAACLNGCIEVVPLGYSKCQL